MATVNDTKADLEKLITEKLKQLTLPERLTVLRYLIPKLTHLEEDLLSEIDGE